MGRFVRWLDRRLWQPLVGLLRQGVTPKKLALSVTLGLALGIFPMIGATTLLCFIVGYLLRLNPVAIQVVNYFTYPLQLALYIPFFHLGALVFDVSAIPFSIDEIFARLAQEPLQVISELWSANLRAVFAWMLVVSPLVWITTRFLHNVFARVASAMDSSGSVAKVK